MNANFKYLIYCFIAFLAYSCKEDAVDPVEDLAYFKEDYESFLPVRDIDGMFSPDGSKIVFRRIPLTLEYLDEWGLYIMDSDGRNLKMFFKGICGPAKFSPDSKKLAFSSESGLAILNLENGIFKQMNYPSLGGYLDWAPSGKEIVCGRYSEEDNGGEVLGIIDTNLDRTTYRQITKSKTGDAKYPLYSNDGLYVYFLKYSLDDNSRYKSIQRINLSTLKTDIIVDDDFDSYFINISKNGSFFVHNILDFNMILRNLQGGFFQRIPLRGHTPSFHPNGKTILFSSPDSAGVGVRLATYDLETGKLSFIRYY